jgi:Mce-associated membrane protein
VTEYPNPSQDGTTEPAPDAPTRTRFAEPPATAVQPTRPVDEPAAPPAATAPPVTPAAPVAPIAGERPPQQEPSVEEPPPHEPSAPVAEVPATEVPPSEVPPSEVPATEVPAAEVPPTEVPATEVAADPLPVVAAAAAPEQPAPEASEPARAGRVLVRTLLALVVALAALVGYLSYTAATTAGPAPDDSARHAALEAARSSARVIFSYDYRHLDKDFKAGRDVTTGQFRSEYDKTTGKLVQDVAPRYKAVVLADVSDAGVVDVSGDRVRTLVFVNQESTSTLMATPKITQSRLEMTMLHTRGHWLVEKIKAF